MSMQPKGLPVVPAQTAAVARAAFPKGSLPIRVRDRLAGMFADEPFAARPRSQAGTGSSGRTVFIPRPSCPMDTAEHIPGDRLRFRAGGRHNRTTGQPS
ncbi:hypothetical protein [Streptomyces sioyaensis]|uniref:hypothetical protein n=1 Tax=Streptomyces sioyaensis TaxID=67364 RepID=UPI00379C4B8E